MAYLDNRRRPSPASIAGVVAVHAAVGAALIVGLSIKGVLVEPEVLAGFNVDPVVPPPPPVPTPQPSAGKASPSKRTVTVPLPPIPLPSASPFEDTTTDIVPARPPVEPGLGNALDKVEPLPTPSFTPVGATPRNDPKSWVTADDYRGNWIRQEMTGTARFQLEIAADGRVARCTIIGSSGHPELDAATCSLVSRRARFQPARGGGGEPVTGSYTNSIKWQLPE